MNEQRLVKISKYLSKHLRHQPKKIGLALEPGGWIKVRDLLAACNAHGMPLNASDLEEVVARNNKQRFAFDEAHERIRANQGHSIEIDLQLEAVQPPDVLFHGTAQHALEAIRQDGLQKMSRHHVHLSPNKETAFAVGARHGKPVVLRIDTRRMYETGFLFFCSANGVWLTEEIPPEFLLEDTNGSA